jgi:hypothetical protein
MLSVPGNIKLTDREAIRRVVREQHRRGDKSTARTLTKLVIEHLPDADCVERTSPQSSQENHGPATGRDMKALAGADEPSSAPLAGEAQLSTEGTTPQRRGTDAKSTTNECAHQGDSLDSTTTAASGKK